MWLIPIFICLGLVVGFAERRLHQQNIEKIPIRINVNGIRGKSTVTRLMTGMIAETGRRTMGKTTGTMARMIDGNTKQETPIQRRLEGPNIREQRLVVKEAAQQNVEALVSECMAVNPDYQVVFQDVMVQANIGVIVNVLEDHMDQMGPTLDHVAETFAATIPYKGTLIVDHGPYQDYFKKIAYKRRTKVIVADETKVTEEQIRQFEYMIFPEHIALALAVAEALQIDEDTALKGMLNANPDPYVTRIYPIGDKQAPAYFVNGFAANDATSTLAIWDSLKKAGYPHHHPVVVMNCREDRYDRTEHFAKQVLPHISMQSLVVIGSATQPVLEAYEQGQLNVQKLHNLEGKTTEEIMEVLQPYCKERIIYAIGNLHGAGLPLIEQIEQHSLAKEVHEADQEQN